MPTRARLRWIFIGPSGLRPGWGMAIFITMISAIFGIVALAGHLAHVKTRPPKGDIKPGFILIGEGVQTLIVLGATWVMAKIERRSFWSYGLMRRSVWFNFGVGLLGGLGCLSLLVAVLTLDGNLVFDGRALNGIAIPAYGLLLLVAFILVGASEETLFRGYLQSTLARGIGFWPAGIVMSLLFAAAHTTNPGESIFGIIGVFGAGIAFCLLLWASGSLWLGIGFHAGWDWAQSYLYGTPDSGLMMRGHFLISHAAGNPRLSGGSAGPEGSLLAEPVSLAGVLLLVWLWRRAGWQRCHEAAASVTE